MIGLIVIALLFLFVYLAVLRPQRRRRLDQAQRLQSLEEGTQVLTAGGIYGTVVGFDADELLVEIAPGVQIKLDRRAVGRIIEPAVLEEADEAAPDELEPPSGSTAGEPDGSYSEDPR